MTEAQAYLEGLQREAGAALQRVTEARGPSHQKALRRAFTATGRVFAARSLLGERWPALLFVLSFDTAQQDEAALPRMPRSDRPSIQAWLPLVVTALRQLRSVCDVPVDVFGMKVTEQIMRERVYLTCFGLSLEAVRLWTALGVLDQVGFETATHELVQTAIPTMVGRAEQGRIIR